jgi:hypothetical protein
MVSLFDLPGEIRNQIWDLCLVSPTRTLKPVCRRDAFYSGFPRSCSQSGPFFYLLVDNTNLIMGQHYGDERQSTISLSLPRTCRKIYEETNNLFWTSNTFHFPSPHSLLQTFNLMGRSPQRCISSIRLCITPLLGNDIEWLDRILKLLIFQGKHCSIRRLELLIDIDSIEQMASSQTQHWYFNLHIKRSNWREKALPCLQQAHRLQNTEKILVITHARELATAQEVHEYSIAGNLDALLRDMQESLGGELYWGSTKVFGDSKEVLPEMNVSAPLDEKAGSEVGQMESLGQGGLE